MAYGDGDRGVGGWLAFFLVTLGIFGPLALAVSGYLTLSDPTLPLAYGDAWPTLLSAEIGLILTLLAISWFAVWRFLKKFNWTTVRIGIASLWTLSILSVFGEAALVSVIAGLDLGTLMPASAIPEMVRPFGYSTIWTLYLLLSKRVRATYGDVPVGEVEEVFQ